VGLLLLTTSSNSATKLCGIVILGYYISFLDYSRYRCFIIGRIRQLPVLPTGNPFRVIRVFYESGNPRVTQELLAVTPAGSVGLQTFFISHAH